ncbi:MAG: beta-N-acetylglucosaminidase [Calditrichaeota bacterium]|nr:MAG: beta-N-acetylglucosaminidase [Calditrichota bacterium]
MTRNHMRTLKQLFLGTLFLLVLFGCAGVRDKAPADWVKKYLSTMSIEEKIGQMMVIAYSPRFYNQNDAQYKRLVRLIRKYHVGGAAFFKGEPYAVARCIERFQKEASLPLLIMADMEWGVAMRVNQATLFPENMAIGATRSESYAYEVGKITAREARALGIHIGFVPVMDVNSNPDNVIINTRAYGEDPLLVSRLGTAFIRGLQENGVYATAKHFPGHGDTNMDSHLGLPTVTAPPERIKTVELVPFQAAVDAGVKAIMVAHITYSGFPQMEGRPATLDPYFLQEVLRKRMGFKGLIFTDAMDMGGITENYWSGEAAVMAINAGADMLLFPPDFEATFDFVVQAVKEGRIPMKTVDAAVERILRTKAEFGLLSTPSPKLEEIESVVATSEHLQKAEEMFNASMTLVRDDSNIIPLPAEKLDSALVVIITDGDYGYIYKRQLSQAVSKRIPIVRTAVIDYRSGLDDIEKLVTLTDSAQVIITGVFVRWASYKGSVTLPDTTLSLLKQFFRINKPMAVVAFGSPYLLRQIPEAPTYLCAYSTSPQAIGAATRAIFGEIPLTATLPVSIPGYYNIGDGLKREVRKMELVKHPRDDLFQEAYRVLEKAIADSIFPGAQIAIVLKDTLLASRGFGHHTYDKNSPPVTPSTIYDLASITKVAATTVVAMRLWEKKKIQLDIPVKSYLPKFSGGEKDSVTLRHLLTHSAGVHWWVDLWNKAKTKEEALDYICQLPLDYTPGDSMIYSDLGIILVGKILETITGKPIDQLATQLIYKPMGMTNTMFNPPKDLLSRIAPTEIGGSMHRGLIHGEVHDENAFFFGGVSTHAGLFSTAEDLAALSQMLLNGGIYRHYRFFTPQTIQYWTTRQNLPEGSSRALGWDTPSDHGSSAGDYFSPGSFGHLGFTGTSMWIDPNREIAIILLTNRVYPTRERGGIYEVRRDFYNAAMRALLKYIGEKPTEEEPTAVEVD